MTTENTRMQSVHEDEGQLTLRDLRALVAQCNDMDDEALVYAHEAISDTLMDVPEAVVIVVVEKTTT